MVKWSKHSKNPPKPQFHSASKYKYKPDMDVTTASDLSYLIYRCILGSFLMIALNELGIELTTTRAVSPEGTNSYRTGTERPEGSAE